MSTAVTRDGRATMTTRLRAREREALELAARRHRRSLSEQIAALVADGLEREGYLQPEHSDNAHSGITPHDLEGGPWARRHG